MCKLFWAKKQDQRSSWLHCVYVYENKLHVKNLFKDAQFIQDTLPKFHYNQRWDQFEIYCEIKNMFVHDFNKF